jgi:hypothetical protein
MTQSAESNSGVLLGTLSRKPRARAVRPTRARSARPTRPARLLPTLPLRYAVASLEHWLDLNA